MADIISVAMATYNGEKYLCEQLDSLYSQTILPDEIIVVDDCSTDNTINILENYKKSKGLKYYINLQNIGVNKNFERAIMLCTGDYIALCDQDDIWMSHKLETSYNKIKEIENGMPAVVSSRYISINSNGEIFAKPKYISDSDSYAVTLLGHSSQGCSLMMNKKLKEKVIPMCDGVMFDIYIGLTAAMIGNKYNIGEPLMYYRHHESNVCPKYNNKKTPLLLRLKKRAQIMYPGFIPNRRYKNMLIMESIQRNHFIKEREKLFYSILSLFDISNILKHICTILTIKELSLIKKINIISNMLFSRLLRIFIKEKCIF